MQYRTHSPPSELFGQSSKVYRGIRMVADSKDDLVTVENFDVPSKSDLPFFTFLHIGQAVMSERIIYQKTIENKMRELLEKCGERKILDNQDKEHMMFRITLIKKGPSKDKYFLQFLNNETNIKKTFLVDNVHRKVNWHGEPPRSYVLATELENAYELARIRPEQHPRREFAWDLSKKGVTSQTFYKIMDGWDQEISNANLSPDMRPKMATARGQEYTRYKIQNMFDEPDRETFGDEANVRWSDKANGIAKMLTYYGFFMESSQKYRIIPEMDTPGGEVQAFRVYLQYNNEISPRAPITCNNEFDLDGNILVEPGAPRQFQPMPAARERLVISRSLILPDGNCLSQADAKKMIAKKAYKDIEGWDGRSYGYVINPYTQQEIKGDFLNRVDEFASNGTLPLDRKLYTSFVRIPKPAKEEAEEEGAFMLAVNLFIEYLTTLAEKLQIPKEEIDEDYWRKRCSNHHMTRVFSNAMKGRGRKAGGRRCRTARN